MRLLAIALLLLSCLPAVATTLLGQADLSADRLLPHSCLDAARAAERDHALPPALLAAIGRVESGRWDRRSGQLAPWPWTVNAQGIGHAFATAQDAVSYVVALQARGVRSIDVGCFQVNLLYHPAAFASLEQAFDPDANSLYAADFLNRLHARSGSWDQAIGDYHSMTPAQGTLYRQRVVASLAGADVVPWLADSTSGSWLPHTARSWSDPVTILASAAARSVHVFGPDGPQTSGPLQENHMPRVLRP